MKRAVILHGTDGKPDSNWFMWLKAKLEAQGYDVWVPELPGNHAPDLKVYNDFLLDNTIDLTNSVLIGHSSGAVQILNLLMDERCPKIKAVALVSAWEHGYPNGDFWETGQFDRLFPDGGFDYGAIRTKCQKFTMFHAEHDPYCPLAQAQHIAEQLGGELTVLPEASHLGDNHPEFPELWQAMEPNL